MARPKVDMSKRYLYQGFDEAVIELSHRTKGHAPEQVEAIQSFELKLCALFMPRSSFVLVSRTFLEEASATRLCLHKNRALCEEGFVRLLTNTIDPYREREKKQHNYQNVRHVVKYHQAYYDIGKSVADYSSLLVEKKDFDTGSLAHSLWVDLGVGKAVNFFVEQEFNDWIHRIADDDTGNSTWESSEGALYASGIPHEMFDDLHSASFATYADSHRHNGVGVVTGSVIAHGLFVGNSNPLDFDLGKYRDFCLRHDLSGIIALASAEEIMAARRVFTSEKILHLVDGQRAVLDENLAKKIRKLLSDARTNRMPDLTPFNKRRFKIALTFPGTHRKYVEQVYSSLLETFAVNDVFYDFKFQADLAGPNLDTKLQSVYLEQSELLVAFLAPDYRKSEWCGLEWRVVRDFIKRRKDDQIMFVVVEGMNEDERPEGLLSIDGYVDAKDFSVADICSMIARRRDLLA